MFLPDVNIRKKASWFKDDDIKDMSKDDSQVLEGVGCVLADGGFVVDWGMAYRCSGWPVQERQPGAGAA